MEAPPQISGPQCSLDGCLWFIVNSTFSTNRLYCATEVQYISHTAEEQHSYTLEQWNNRINQENYMHSSTWAFWRRSPHHG